MSPVEPTFRASVTPPKPCQVSPLRLRRCPCAVRIGKAAPKGLRKIALLRASPRSQNWLKNFQTSSGPQLFDGWPPSGNGVWSPTKEQNSTG